MPKWQYTLSATQANVEVIRIARHLTGRDVVVVFDGKWWHSTMRTRWSARSPRAMSR
jgi:glutamate-1-semialdehyde 2,1-aminomutase